MRACYLDRIFVRKPIGTWYAIGFYVENIITGYVCAFYFVIEGYFTRITANAMP